MRKDDLYFLLVMLTILVLTFGMGMLTANMMNSGKHEVAYAQAVDALLACDNEATFWMFEALRDVPREGLE